MLNIGGLSEENSITFYSDNIKVTSTYEKGKIILKKEKLTTPTKYISNRNTYFKIFFIICICIIKSYIIIPYIQSNTIPVLMYFIPMIIIIGTRIPKIFITIINKKIKNNHAAEHKTLNAYRKHKRIPTFLEEVKTSSKFYYRCGVMFTASYISSQITGFVFLLLFNIIVPEGLLILTFYLAKHVLQINFIGFFIQIFTTKKPKEENNILALTTLTVLVFEIENVLSAKIINN